MRDWWYEVVQEKHPVGPSPFEKLNETILEIQRTQESNQAEIDKLRQVLVDEIRALRPIREQAVEDLKHVPVANISRQANAAISAQGMGMPATLRRTAEQEEE